MYEVWTVFWLELRLLARSRGVWLAMPVTTFFGIWEASMAREAPYAAWSQFTMAALFVTLILTLSTGGQIARDRERRVEDVLLSTPVAIYSYVWGKYLAALAILLVFAASMLAGAVVMDQFDGWRNPPAVLGHSVYPSLGAWPYISAWMWLVVVPVVFGAALSLSTITLLSGHRVVSSMAVVLLWLVPAFLGSSFSSSWATLLDVAGMTLYNSSTGTQLPSALQSLYLTGGSPSPALAAQMVQVVVNHLPPTLPTTFYWNRVLFLTLAMALLVATCVRVGHVRRSGG